MFWWMSWYQWDAKARRGPPLNKMRLGMFVLMASPRAVLIFHVTVGSGRRSRKLIRGGSWCHLRTGGHSVLLLRQWLRVLTVARHCRMLLWAKFSGLQGGVYQGASLKRAPSLAELSSDSRKRNKYPQNLGIQVTHFWGPTLGGSLWEERN